MFIFSLYSMFRFSWCDGVYVYLKNDIITFHTFLHFLFYHRTFCDRLMVVGRRIPIRIQSHHQFLLNEIKEANIIRIDHNSNTIHLWI